MFKHIINSVRVLGRRGISQTPMRGQVNSYTPNNLEKKFLVWTGKYKNESEIPTHVSAEIMERCRNKIRIRLANIMMALTVVGCAIMVYSGKEAAKRGESVSKQNLDWHKSYKEQQSSADKKE